MNLMSIRVVELDGEITRKKGETWKYLHKEKMEGMVVKLT